MTAKKKYWPDGDQAFFLVWNPESDKPPTVMFQTWDQADAVALRFAEEVDGPVYVLRAYKTYHRPPVKVTAFK